MEKKLWFKANLSKTNARPDKVWFRAKLYGWGWQPVSWQGWAVTALYLFAVLKSTWSLAPQGSAIADLKILAIHVVPPTICLILICYLKGERPRWRWGK